MAQDQGQWENVPGQTSATLDKFKSRYAFASARGCENDMLALAYAESIVAELIIRGDQPVSCASPRAPTY